MPSYNRVVLAGALADGAESWSVGFNYGADLGSGVSSPSDLTQWAEEIMTDFTVMAGTSLERGLSENGRLTSVSTYWYPNVGAPALYVGQASGIANGIGTSLHPLPTAAVMSLRTALSGRRYRGRAYWPAIGWSVDGDGKFAGTDPSVAPLEFAELLEGIANRPVPGGALFPAVVSQVGNVVTPVTQVSVGDVPDTQRGRRDNLVELYQSSAYPPP